MALVWLQMAAFTPFIPGIDEHDLLCGRMVFPGLFDNLAQPILIGLGRGIGGYMGTPPNSRGIIPGRHHTTQAAIASIRFFQERIHQPFIIIDSADKFRIQLMHTAFIFWHVNTVRWEFA